MSQMLRWDKIGVSNVAGELALVCGLVMWVTSLGRVRRKMFELFYYTHHLYFLFFVFFILHVGTSFYGLANFGLILPGIYLFLVDRCLRFLQSRRRVGLHSARLLPCCDTLELSFTKTPGLRYSPASIMFLNVPSISRLQWHPFTITSSSSLEQDTISVVIKSEGSWSRKLYDQMLSSASNSPDINPRVVLNSLDQMDVSVEGPYDRAPASSPNLHDFLKYEKIVMVSGGSGITPFISIIRELIFMSSKPSQVAAIPQVQLVCSFKNSEQLSMLDLLLPLAGTRTYCNCNSSRLQLQIEAYVTREEGPNKNNNQKHELQRNYLIRYFKPDPSRASVSAVLGPNGWLWLAAVISSSFLIFLILLGITTRYYIYPIDHNTNRIFSNSSKALLNMFFICVSILVASTAAVVWNSKKERTMVGSAQVEDPSWFCSNNNDPELESLPHQSLAESVRVHYGSRPHLQKILSESSCEEGSSNIGVFVSGPKEMRQCVAGICSCGCRDNLHFESISFTW